MNDMLNEEDRFGDSVTVRVFESEAARDRFVDQLRRASPKALGVAAMKTAGLRPKIDELSKVRGRLLDGAGLTRDLL